jgi:hypothetical protein
MLHLKSNYYLKLLLCSFIFLAGFKFLHAQAFSEGFDQATKATATGNELRGLENLFGMEVHFKPMRMIAVNITNPKTGKKERKLVWYLLYRCVNRPLNREKLSSSDSPVNQRDKNPESIFSPSFVLITTDGNAPLKYPDEVLPEAVEQINKREGRKYLNTVDVIQTVPKPTMVKDIRDDAIYGVVTWSNIDPETDNFTVLMSGFTNAYQIMKTPDGKKESVEKLLKQDFWRPGDEFEEEETEIRRKGSPEWLYPGELIGLKSK